MKKTYFVTWVGPTDEKGIVDVRDLDPIYAETFQEAKQEVIRLYGPEFRFKPVRRKYRPEVAGCFYI